MASEIKSFLELDDFPKKINRNTLQNLFAYSQTDGCLLEGIESLKPACYLKYNLQNHKITIRPYFKIVSYAEMPPYQLSIEEAADHFQQLLHQSIRRQIKDAKKVAVQLSGGIDSTLIAKYLKDEKENRPIKFYSLINKDFDEYNEESRIDHVTSVLGINTTKINFNEKLLEECFEKSIDAYERMISLPSPIGIYEITKLAHPENSIIFSGSGADSKSCSASAIIFLHYAKLYQEHKNMAKGPKIAKRIPGTDEFLKNFLMIEGIEQSIKKILPSYDNRRELKKRRKLWDSLEGDTFTKFKSFASHFGTSELESQNHLCMSNSLPVRFPFLDNDVVEFLYRLPLNILTHQNESKAILKYNSQKSMAKILLKNLKVLFEFLSVPF